jgi:hypothetical protein
MLVDSHALCGGILRLVAIASGCTNYSLAAHCARRCPPRDPFHSRGCTWCSVLGTLAASGWAGAAGGRMLCGLARSWSRAMEARRSWSCVAVLALRADASHAHWAGGRAMGRVQGERATGICRRGRRVRLRRGGGPAHLGIQGPLRHPLLCLALLRAHARRSPAVCAHCPPPPFPTQPARASSVSRAAVACASPPHTSGTPCMPIKPCLSSTPLPGRRSSATSAVRCLPY